ncbi:MAG TPA: hypothetical protein VMN76_02825 [Acidobacteriota bacterium]|nr:hypothetical protein [Acidobacteriota bacterium]
MQRAAGDIGDGPFTVRHRPAGRINLKPETIHSQLESLIFER